MQRDQTSRCRPKCRKWGKNVKTHTIVIFMIDRCPSTQVLVPIPYMLFKYTSGLLKKKKKKNEKKHSITATFTIVQLNSFFYNEPFHQFL